MFGPPTLDFDKCFTFLMSPLRCVRSRFDSSVEVAVEMSRPLQILAWGDGQLTPLCSRCDDLREFCHFCKKVAWATPPEWPQKKQGDREKSKPPEEQGLSEQGKRNEKSEPPEERGLHEQGKRERQEGEYEVVEGHEDHTGDFEEWVKCE